MCTVLDKRSGKTFTGYKVVTKIKGRYYSPFSGYCYKKGPLPSLKCTPRNAARDFVDSTYAIFHSMFYTTKMHGKSGVLVTLADAELIVSKNKDTILKMTVGGDLYDGEFDDFKTVIGTEIIDFEEVEI